MSRSEEFNAGSAGRLHPNLRDYRSDAPGGIGSVGGSVVGRVPTHVLAQYRHHEGDVDSYSSLVVNRIANDIQRGHGLEEPAILEYDPKTNWAYLGEGNHRLRAAEIAGAPDVPVRIMRSSNPRLIRELEGRGAPAYHRPEAEMGRGHVPQHIHPDMLRLGEERAETKDPHSEIMDLLGPTGRF